MGWKSKKDGTHFNTDKTIRNSSSPDTEVNIEIDNDSDDFAEGVRKDFASKNADEHGVTLDVIKELQELENDKDISIEEVDDGLNTVSGVGKYLTLSNGATWNLFSDYDEMREEAKARVRQDLEDAPELFNQDWLSNYITISDTDRRIISNEEADSRLDGLDIDELRELADEYGVDYKKSWDEDKLRDEVSYEISKDIEEKLKDPIKYFVEDEGMYSREDLLKQSFIITDIDEAVESAIRDDGVEHFISGYDGESHETKDGQYLVKHND